MRDLLRPIVLSTMIVGLMTPTICQAQDTESSIEPSKPRYAGPIEGGFLLPNGWTIRPAGRHVVLNDLILDIHTDPSSRYALVASSGYNKHELSLIDLEAAEVVGQADVFQSWFGLAVDDETSRIWWSGGGAGLIHQFTREGSTLIKGEPIEPGEATETVEARRADNRFRSGLLLSPDKSTLYSLDIDAGTITAIDLASGGERVAEVGQRPYDVVLSRNGARIYISDWADRCVLVVDPDSLRVIRRIAVGEHPNQIAVHPSDNRLFVACSSSNSVSVIDTSRGIVTETIVTALFPNAPEGSTPDAVAVSSDGSTLFVANADNNCVAVVDITAPSQSLVRGFIPTGWYPTALAVTPDGRSLLVGVGKGNQTKANPFYDEEDDREGGRPGLPYPYIGTTLSGALSIVPIPNNERLQEYTETVYENCPYSDELLGMAPSERETVIPTNVGQTGPIEHVLYIIKENRTYDQVFGDMPEGNGDPSLVMFGEEVTPNHHKLAREFVLLDNLYCNGQVSRDGHPWSTMAYNTDYIARDWLLTYSGRGGVDDDDEQDLSTPPSGFIWDLCARHGLTYRSYGEYTDRQTQPDGTVKSVARVPGLVGHVHPTFRVPKVPGTRARDTDNADIFIEEFRQFERDGNLPRFMIMSLGEDHTDGTRPGRYTPQACVGSNDLALGRIIDVVSHSSYWPKTAIFVIQDDAQNGPDHVDAHRTVGLVISPYTKRQAVVSTQYTTSSMLRTIELILGLPPMSQYDAAATPMFDCFEAEADLTPYDHVPARIDLNAKNTLASYGAQRSLQMNFDEYDQINDFELNEILWGAIKGPDAPLPPAVRRAIVYRPSAAKVVLDEGAND